MTIGASPCRRLTAGVKAPLDTLRQVLAQVAKVAPTDSTVLISGEIGTGKELIARAVHKLSNRSARALIRVNWCGDLAFADCIRAFWS